MLRNQSGRPIDKMQCDAKGFPVNDAERPLIPSISFTIPAVLVNYVIETEVIFAGHLKIAAKTMTVTGEY